MTGRALTNIKRPAEPWRQRLIRSLLYGRNVDRAEKARARVGLAILLFAAIYAVLAGRLVMFAVGADSHGARRTGSQDAIATARPDIVDRNGELLARDLPVKDLYARPAVFWNKPEAARDLAMATGADELVHAADAAMYQVKDRGKNGIQAAAPGRHQQAGSPEGVSV